MNDRKVLAALRTVIGMEAAALDRVRASIGAGHARAVRMIAACRGKVFVTGTGKSGLIAQKIAATLSSTGTPAVYLHPTDGLHGSLGSIQKADLVLAIGKSGESAELNDILPALRRIGARVIALTANPRSTLARAAALVLDIPVDKEACPLNLAPTCSTTAALAVGDALAVALMKLRGFRAENFALLHPGGRLGKRLTLTVADVMHDGADNPVVRLDATVPEMLIELTRQHTGAVSVVDRRGRLAGLITDFDLRKVLARGEDLRAKRLAEIMNPNPTAIGPEALVVDAMDLMLDRKKPFALLPVVDARRRAVGMIHLHDIRKFGI